MEESKRNIHGDDCPACFGRFRCDAPECRACPYPDSCKFYRDNPPPKDPNARYSKGHYVSIDQYGYSEELATEFDAEDDSRPTEDRTPLTREDLKDLLHFLLYAIDDYTLAIILEMLRTGHRDTVTLAEAFGVSKQAMHQKIGIMCDTYPQLRPMIELVMRRCAKLASPEGRKSLKGRNPHNREAKARENDEKGRPESKPEQMLFDFD
ncbi:MAG: hypothetical protein J5654_09560 [Victivallales bacterium]|nr:hypothetical protein [Victivallales bacterium]